MPETTPETPKTPSESSKTLPLEPALPGSQRVSLSFVQRLVALCLAVGLIGGGIGAYGLIKLSPGNVATTKQQVVVQENSAVVDVAKKLSPSVVSITTKQVTAGFFGQPETAEGAGTGMIVTSDGLILTNKHVVPDGTSAVTVIDYNGKQYTGSVVSRDPINDIAFVRISASGLPAVELGDSSAVLVGTKVVAIGNALGQFQNSVTEGIISGVSREIDAGDETGGSSEELQNVFQTDAAINSGNSGGPLVNLSGQVIGMNTAVASQGAQNIGFAIPINDIKSDLASVKSKGTIIRPYLGVRFVQLTKDIASANSLKASAGAWVQGDNINPAIVPGSPADKAGLKVGDIITKVAGTTIDATHSLQTLISNHQVGDKVALTVIRDGKTQTINVTLEAAPTTQ